MTTRGKSCTTYYLDEEGDGFSFCFSFPHYFEILIKIWKDHSRKLDSSSTTWCKTPRLRLMDILGPESSVITPKGQDPTVTS